MKNIEKYTNTKDALETYNTIGDKWIPFDVWLELEYKDPLPPTLLEAASDAVDALTSEVVKGWYKPDGNFGEKMRVLRSAIEREKVKPILNCDKYKTAAEASNGFKVMCNGIPKCDDCRLRHFNCSIAWLYEEADKEVPE